MVQPAITTRDIARMTGGDNGLSGLTRPSPFGIDLGPPDRFYFFTLGVLVVVAGAIAIWVRSPFGASIRATRDQARRASALGFNVWLIRWLTFVVSGFLGGVAGLMYVYYHQFISPHSISLANSAEMLLMVIAGGPGTLVGPVLGATLVVLLKNLASAYVDRWVMAGYSDPICSLTATRALSQGLAGATTEIFADASHFFLIEQPERFNRLLVEWLAARRTDV